MLLIRCANGVVEFLLHTDVKKETVSFQCLNDGTSATQPRTPVGVETLLQAVAQKAVALRGAITTIIDIPEIY